MKRVTKKVLSMLATVAMTLTLFALPVNVYAQENVAKIGEIEYATLEEAIRIANNSKDTTVTLLHDVELNSDLQVGSGQSNVTVDLNGHHIDGLTNGQVYTAGNGNILFTGNGKISNTKSIVNSGDVPLNIIGGNVVLDGITV